MCQQDISGKMTRMASDRARQHGELGSTSIRVNLTWRWITNHSRSCRQRSRGNLGRVHACTIRADSVWAGKARLLRFYYDVAVDRQKHIVQGIYRLVSTRADDSCCCFVEDDTLFGPDHKIIYRHFATLYFIFVADGAESELGVLDLIQVFVQVLDNCFENVCELDLIYHFDRVNYILDEIVMAGMVLETNADLILKAVKDDFDDFLNASGDEEDEQLEKTTRPARRGGSPSYRGGEGGYASYGLGRYGLRADPYADIDLDRPTPKVSKSHSPGLRGRGQQGEPSSSPSATVRSSAPARKATTAKSEPAKSAKASPTARSESALSESESSAAGQSASADAGLNSVFASFKAEMEQQLKESAEELKRQEEEKERKKQEEEERKRKEEEDQKRKEEEALKKKEEELKKKQEEERKKKEEEELKKKQEEERKKQEEEERKKEEEELKRKEEEELKRKEEEAIKRDEEAIPREEERRPQVPVGGEKSDTAKEEGQEEGEDAEWEKEQEEFEKMWKEEGAKRARDAEAKKREDEAEAAHREEQAREEAAGE
ncbi:unnamed protein product, partial [Effrenium voratum]